MKEFKHKKLNEAFDDSFDDNENDYTDITDNADRDTLFIKAFQELYERIKSQGSYARATDKYQSFHFKGGDPRYHVYCSPTLINKPENGYAGYEGEVQDTPFYNQYYTNVGEEEEQEICDKLGVDTIPDTIQDDLFNKHSDAIVRTGGYKIYHDAYITLALMLGFFNWEEIADGFDPDSTNPNVGGQYLHECVNNIYKYQLGKYIK